ncbi:DUF1826 domain-containing protein [Reinekea blandensis]|uniref:Succinylglutamate desuccinylase n=1 Tax=Reinekea blandensis MED297 TaxID=314283 RepID=A4BAY5_9GAMM|nr:DUF1826 domain-containing protein [Reinekea blandensis]EAR10598.1 hypothetical protein MED297_11300 [Reinekea sp. MED297] [Reinekea blandensis MED297]
MTAQPFTQSLSFSRGQSPMTLADIYQDEINIAIWERSLHPELVRAVSTILTSTSTLNLACTVSVSNCVDTLTKELGGDAPAHRLARDIGNLVDMYCCLFDLDVVALRLTKLDRAMCPKFHVDHVPARLVTTYQGVGSEWLENWAVDRRRLGRASAGIPDDQSGLYGQHHDIQKLVAGDVALLKGERWIGNEGRGIVHRSPAVADGEPRLLLTFDFTESDEAS